MLDEHSEFIERTIRFSVENAHTEVIPATEFHDCVVRLEMYCTLSVVHSTYIIANTGRTTRLQAFQILCPLCNCYVSRRVLCCGCPRRRRRRRNVPSPFRLIYRNDGLDDSICMLCKTPSETQPNDMLLF